MPRACDERVDDRARIGVGGEALAAIDHSVSPGSTTTEVDLRAALGGGKGGPAERRTRLARRHHEPEPECRGDEPTPPVDSGGSVAARAARGWGGDGERRPSGPNGRREGRGPESKEGEDGGHGCSCGAGPGQRAARAVVVTDRHSEPSG